MLSSVKTIRHNIEFGNFPLTPCTISNCKPNMVDNVKLSWVQRNSPILDRNLNDRYFTNLLFALCPRHLYSGVFYHTVSTSLINMIISLGISSCWKLPVRSDHAAKGIAGPTRCASFLSILWWYLSSCVKFHPKTVLIYD